MKRSENNSITRFLFTDGQLKLKKRSQQNNETSANVADVALWEKSPDEMVCDDQTWKLVFSCLFLRLKECQECAPVGGPKCFLYFLNKF